MQQGQQSLSPNRYRLVDDREPSELRERLIELGWEQKRLYSGDFMFLSHNYKKIGITRKSVADLVNSIGETFSKQLEEMLDYYDRNFIIIEGSWTKVYDDHSTTYTGVPVPLRKMVWNYLTRLREKGFIINLTTTPENTITRLNELYALYQKEYSLSSKSRQFEDDRVLSFPSGTRGISGLKVLNMLGSIRAVANATLEQLMEVDGIGEKRANSIWNHFNRSVNAN